MRHMILLAAFALTLVLSACSDTPTATTSSSLGRTTVEAIQANTGYSTWYDPGYQSYPDAANQAEFQQQVDMIKANMDGTHKVIMVIKPTCSCQKTQLYFPRAMKTLDAAGFPREDVEVYITDARMAGIDSLRNAIPNGIADAPTFIVLKNGVEKGRMVEDPAFGSTVEKDLAGFFAKP